MPQQSSMSSQGSCIECDRAFSAGEEKFRINDRFWCATCARPYLSHPLASALRDVGMFGLASVSGLVTWIAVAQTPLARLSMFAGAGVFVWIFGSWVMRTKVQVERVSPRQRTRALDEAGARPRRSGA